VRARDVQIDHLARWSLLRGHCYVVTVTWSGLRGQGYVVRNEEICAAI